MQSRRPQSRTGVPLWERALLTVVFGALILLAFAYQAVEVAASVGWIAYPLVAAVALVSFLVARAAWHALTSELRAAVERQRRVAERQGS